MNTKQHLSGFTFLFGLALGGFFLWLALRNVDFAAVAGSLKTARLWFCLPFIITLSLFYWLKAIRWSDFLRPVKQIKPADLVPSMIVGFAGNNILPIRLGELVRMYLLSKETDLPKSTVLATIVLERMFDALSILSLLTVAMYISATNSVDLAAARVLLMIATVIAFFGAYCIVYTPAWLLVAVRPVFMLMPSRFRQAANQRLIHVQQGFASLRGRREIIKILINSIVQWSLLSFCIFLAIKAFDVSVTPYSSVLVLGLVVAGISLPSAPGFVGTIEYCFVAGLGFFGVAPSEALAIAIFYHALTFASVTLAGAFYFRRYNQSWAETRMAAEKLRSSDN